MVSLARSLHVRAKPSCALDLIDSAAPEVTPLADDANRYLAGRRRRGLTLTEVLIAITLTLILLGVLIQMFNYTSGKIARGRAVMEMSGQLRMTTERLRNDLSGVTVELRPWLSPGDGQGYFEYLEGTPHVDDPTAIDTSIGDIDDVLMFTARSAGRPFRGRLWIPGSTQPTIIESDLAEIIWWTTLEDSNDNGVMDTGEELVLHRRVLLVRPDLNNRASGSVWPNNNWQDFFERNDISVHASANGLSANSLSDLTRRENRFAHYIGFGYPSSLAPNRPAFPPNNDLQLTAALQENYGYPIDRPNFTDVNNGFRKWQDGWLNRLVLSGNYEGEDVVLSNLVAFDVKAYDLFAPVYDNRNSTGTVIGDVALVPSDPGYAAELQRDLPQLNGVISQGAFVDLGYELPFLGPPFNMPLAAALDTQFSNAPRLFSGLFSPGGTAPPPPIALVHQFLWPQLTYCTWTTHYESDGFDQDGDGAIDEGSNGIDDNPAQGNGTDDESERETSPPYPSQLRGIQVEIRLIESDTQQVRQATFVHNFIPE